MKERLKILRKNLRLTQKEFGEKIGLADTSISNMEAGRTPINSQNVKVICFTFGINEDWFVNGSGEIFNPKSKISREEEQIIEIYMRLSPTAQKLFVEYGKKLLSDERILRGEADVEKGHHPIHDREAPLEPIRRPSTATASAGFDEDRTAG
jgi:transcriptional regulator with XRE-family HTH domain